MFSKVDNSAISMKITGFSNN